jgi:hypothetical protein
MEAGAQGEKMNIKIEQHTFMGGLWVGAWLFTIGFLHLSFWKGLLAIVLCGSLPDGDPLSASEHASEPRN